MYILVGLTFRKRGHYRAAVVVFNGKWHQYDGLWERNNRLLRRNKQRSCAEKYPLTVLEPRLQLFKRWIALSAAPDSYPVAIYVFSG